LAGEHQKFPPSLNAARSEFQKLCDTLGGPADLTEAFGYAKTEGLVPLDALDLACGQFPFHATWPVFREWCSEEDRARRYWPWIAYAADGYQFERREKRNYGPELKPGQVHDLLARISSNAQKLCEDIALLQELGNRLDDPRVPYRRRHLSWLDEYLAQSVTFGPRPDIADDGEMMMLADFGRRKFIRQLIALDVAATAANERVTPELLAKRAGPTDLGARNLVYRAKMIWESLKNRPASVHPVRPRPDLHPTHANDDRSDFVLFVSAIATLATGIDGLTPGQIAKALGP